MIPYVRLGIAAAALAAAFGGGWKLGNWAKEAQIAQLREAHAQAVTASLEAQREREAQIAQKVERIAHETQALQAAIAADAARAARTASGLRDAAHAVASQCGSGATATPGSPPASSPGFLLAELLAEVERAGRDMAAEADRRGLAGQACARAWESLRP